jgi:hypothetical protein
VRQEHGLVAEVVVVWHKEPAAVQEQAIIQAPGRLQLAVLVPLP